MEKKTLEDKQARGYLDPIKVCCISSADRRDLPPRCSPEIPSFQSVLPQQEPGSCWVPLLSYSPWGFHLVTQRKPWRRARRKTCPESQQARSRERWAGESRRHPGYGISIALAFLSFHLRDGKTYGEGTGTPGATTVDLGQVGELSEGGLVAERDVDEAVVSKRAHGGESSGLLTTTLGTGGDEETGVLSPETTGGPDAASLVPEGLPLGREVTVTGGDTEENGIVLEEGLGLNDGVAGLARGVHQGEDILRKSLLDPVVSSSASDMVARFYYATYWKISAFPPAASIPFFSASASLTM